DADRITQIRPQRNHRHRGTFRGGHQLVIEFLHYYYSKVSRSRVTVTATLSKSAGMGAWGLLTVTCTELISAKSARIASATVVASVSSKLTGSPLMMDSTTAATSA